MMGSHHLILRVVTKLLVGTIILFALYVQFHGDYSPGGGFQAGVIFAVAFILYGVVFSLRQAKEVFPPWLVWAMNTSTTAPSRPSIRRMASIGASWWSNSVSG